MPSIESTHDWSELYKYKIEFKRVNAIVPVPATHAGHACDYYIFYDDKYMRLVFSDKQSPKAQSGQGPRELNDWNTINDAGFKSIDAAMAVPGAPRGIYFFKDNNILRCTLSGADNFDKLVDEDFWPLRTALRPFESVDAIMQVPQLPTQYCFFKGQQYIRIDFTKNGPRRVGGINDIWPALVNKGITSLDSLMNVHNTASDVIMFSGDRWARFPVELVQVPTPHVSEPIDF